MFNQNKSFLNLEKYIYTINTVQQILLFRINFLNSLSGWSFLLFNLPKGCVKALKLETVLSKFENFTISPNNYFEC